MKTAILFGATGLVGGYLLEELMENSSYNKIIVVSRKPVAISDSKIKTYITSFENLPDLKHALNGDDLFICLGTTIKKAGSVERMEEIDWKLPVKIAEIACENRVKNIAVVSSVGASNKSRSYYLRIKGAMEQGILGINFQNKIIVRPSILLGNRKEKRFGEKVGKIVMQAFGFLLFGKLKKYKGIHGRTVARAMITLINEKQKQNIYESNELMKFN